MIYFFPPPPNSHTYWFPGQSQVPFPPLRDLITVCKIRPDHSIFQYKSETLNHPHITACSQSGGGQEVLALMLVP